MNFKSHVEFSCHRIPMRTTVRRYCTVRYLELLFCVRLSITDEIVQLCLDFLLKNKHTALVQKHTDSVETSRLPSKIVPVQYQYTVLLVPRYSCTQTRAFCVQIRTAVGLHVPSRQVKSVGARLSGLWWAVIPGISALGQCSLQQTYMYLIYKLLCIQ